MSIYPPHNHHDIYIVIDEKLLSRKTLTLTASSELVTLSFDLHCELACGRQEEYDGSITTLQIGLFWDIKTNNTNRCI
jgi:hypothetical protein